MKDFYEITEQEQEQVLTLASEWVRKHPDAVKRKLKMAEGSVSPSGSDLFNPELWKSSHWSWFFSHLKNGGVSK